jgi:hypothetical protein
MKKSTKIRIVFSGLVVLLLLIPWSMRYRAKARLEAYKRDLLASGEKLAISELAPIPDAQGQRNAAALLQAANKLTAIIDFYPDGMKEIKPGRARVAWRQAELNEEVGSPETFTNVWPLLRAARTKDEDTLNEIRGILSADNIQFPLDYQQADLSPSLADHFMMGRKLAQNAGAEVMLDLRDGLTNEAMKNLLFCVAVSKLCADEPLMISQLVRYAEVADAVWPCWESLQFKGWTDDQLAQLQRQWEAIDLFPAAANSLALERARAPMEFDQTRGSREALDGNPYTAMSYNTIWQHGLVNAREGFKQLVESAASYAHYWIWREIWCFDDERLNMRLYQDMIDATRAAQERQAVLGRLVNEDMREDYVVLAVNRGISRFPVTDYERPEIETFVAHVLRGQTQVEIVTAAIALERYSLAHHQYPPRLDDLVPMFVKRVPIDYMDGKDLRYRLQPDGSYLLYSIGENGVDDGGDPTPPANTPPGFLRGRDWVWPVVATEQEVSVYEAGEARKAAQAQANRGKAGSPRH